MPDTPSPQDRITAFWSTVAPDYEAHPGNVAAVGTAEYDAWVESLRGYLGPAPRDVLDIATGTGFVALIAAGLGHRVTGIDLANPMLEVAAAEARRRALSVDFLPGDAVSPPFPPASFDVLICRHFLWTLREPITALSNWRTLLRPGGRVVAIDGFWFDAAEDDMDPADAGVFEQHYTAETRRALPGMHFTGVDAVVDLFRQAGFSSVAVDHLDEVRRLAEAPPGDAPWYVVIAAG